MAQDSPAVIQVPSIDSLGSKKPRFLPMAVPRDLIDRLKIFHGYPFVWFIGQFLQYLMRPSLQLRWFLDERQARLKITHPIVGSVCSVRSIVRGLESGHLTGTRALKIVIERNKWPPS